jgi:hypothetical protein
MKRRNFLITACSGSLVFSAPFYSLLLACTSNQKPANEHILMMQALLKDWCDGMIKVQINDPANTEIDGALGCPACNKIHGRCVSLRPSTSCSGSSPLLSSAQKKIC